MPTTVCPAGHAAREMGFAQQSAPASAAALLYKSCHEGKHRDQKIFQSSFADITSDRAIKPDFNGFINGAMDAYNNHHHLRIRPEDVWFAILTQLGFFINNHAEELRSLFVAHKGQKELLVERSGTIETVDFGGMAVEMTDLLEKNILDPELRKFIMPTFTTTTETDGIIAAILMMGAMQKYFRYTMGVLCGIPSVTLLGERSDWEAMLKRLEYLPHLGAEPTAFYELLKPVLTKFISSFDAPADISTIEFWNNIAHRKHRGSGTTHLSGWLTAFCFWTANGKRVRDASNPKSEVYELEGVRYNHVDTKDIPPGYAGVPVKVVVYGVAEYNTRMIAGSVGTQLSSSGAQLEGKDGPVMDTLQPVSGWWMYEKGDEPAEVADGAAQRLSGYLAKYENLPTKTGIPPPPPPPPEWL